MWRELSFLEKWNLVTGTMHAMASFGLAVVAVVGLYKVAPIIVYQVEQQEREAQGLTATAGDRAAQSQAADGFVEEALQWWTEQVEAHQRILDLIAQRSAKVSFEITSPQPVPGAPEIESDYLIVIAALPSGQTETVRVPVNENAPSPNQYLQYQINHGAFARLPDVERQAVEGAIASYMHNFMVPKAPPAFVERDMSLAQLRAAIADGQPQRREAIKHLRALENVIDVGLEACRQ